MPADAGPARLRPARPGPPFRRRLRHRRRRRPDRLGALSGDSSEPASGRVDERGSEPPPPRGATPESSRGPATYTVRPGDTLGSIAEDTGVSLDRLQELNPQLDPQTIRTGQRINLRE